MPAGFKIIFIYVCDCHAYYELQYVCFLHIIPVHYTVQYKTIFSQLQMKYSVIISSQLLVVSFQWVSSGGTTICTLGGDQQSEQSTVYICYSYKVAPNKKESVYLHRVPSAIAFTFFMHEYLIIFFCRFQLALLNFSLVVQFLGAQVCRCLLTLQLTKK